MRPRAEFCRVGHPMSDSYLRRRRGRIDRECRKCKLRRHAKYKKLHRVVRIRARREKCLRGHAFDEKNTRVSEFGGYTRRGCRECARWRCFIRDRVEDAVLGRDPPSVLGRLVQEYERNGWPARAYAERILGKLKSKQEKDQWEVARRILRAANSLRKPGHRKLDASRSPIVASQPARNSPK